MRAYAFKVEKMYSKGNRMMETARCNTNVCDTEHLGSYLQVILTFSVLKLSLCTADEKIRFMRIFRFTVLAFNLNK